MNSKRFVFAAPLRGLGLGAGVWLVSTLAGADVLELKNGKTQLTAKVTALVAERRGVNE